MVLALYIYILWYFLFHKTSLIGVGVMFCTCFYIILWYSILYIVLWYFVDCNVCGKYIGVLLVLHRPSRWRRRSDLLKSIDWISFVWKSPEFWKLFNFNCDRPSAGSAPPPSRNWFHKREKFIQKANLIRRSYTHWAVVREKWFCNKIRQIWIRNTEVAWSLINNECD